MIEEDVSTQIVPPGRQLLIHKSSHMYSNEAWMFDADCEAYSRIHVRGKMAAQHALGTYIDSLNEMRERVVAERREAADVKIRAAARAAAGAIAPGTGGSGCRKLYSTVENPPPPSPQCADDSGRTVENPPPPWQEVGVREELAKRALYGTVQGTLEEARALQARLLLVGSPLPPSGKPAAVGEPMRKTFDADSAQHVQPTDEHVQPTDEHGDGANGTSGTVGRTCSATETDSQEVPVSAEGAGYARGAAAGPMEGLLVKEEAGSKRGKKYYFVLSADTLVHYNSAKAAAKAAGVDCVSPAPSVASPSLFRSKSNVTSTVGTPPLRLSSPRLFRSRSNSSGGDFPSEAVGVRACRNSWASAKATSTFTLRSDTKLMCLENGPVFQLCNQEDAPAAAAPATAASATASGASVWKLEAMSMPEMKIWLKAIRGNIKELGRAGEDEKGKEEEAKEDVIDDELKSAITV
jgi:hypothetical protein